MLPSRLVEYERTGDGGVVPRWLLPRDEPWLRELVHEAAAADGVATSEARERILERVTPVARRHGASKRLVEAAWTVERRRWSLRTSSPVPPRTIRRVLFALAAERSREEALATAAAELGLDAARVEALLFADRPRHKILVAPPAPATTSGLAEAYNLALVQSLLGRATVVVAVVRANLRRVVGYAKLLGLMTTFAEADDGATTMTLSGPLALFHDTVKYGNALARWFPSLVVTPGWSLRASVVFAGEPLRFDLGAESPLPRTHAMPRAHDSKLEAKLELDLRRVASAWRIEREVGVIRAAGADGRQRLFFPDFALASDGARVLVEVVGYFTDEYLASKRAMLDAARVPFVMCVDERKANRGLLADPRVVTFDKRIDARALVEACERALIRCATTAPPRSPSPSGV